MRDLRRLGRPLQPEPGRRPGRGPDHHPSRRRTAGEDQRQPAGPVQHERGPGEQVGRIASPGRGRSVAAGRGRSRRLPSPAGPRAAPRAWSGASTRIASRPGVVRQPQDREHARQHAPPVGAPSDPPPAPAPAPSSEPSGQDSAPAGPDHPDQHGHEDDRLDRRRSGPPRTCAGSPGPRPGVQSRPPVRQRSAGSTRGPAPGTGARPSRRPRTPPGSRRAATPGPPRSPGPGPPARRIGGIASGSPEVRQRTADQPDERRSARPPPQQPSATTAASQPAAAVSSGLCAAWPCSRASCLRRVDAGCVRSSDIRASDSAREDQPIPSSRSPGPDEVIARAASPSSTRRTPEHGADRQGQGRNGSDGEPSG